MEKIPLTQRFLGAVLVAVVSGLILHVVIDSPRFALFQGFFGTESRSTEPTVTPSAADTRNSAASQGGHEDQDAGRSGGPVPTSHSEALVTPERRPPSVSPAITSVTSGEVSGKWAGEWSTSAGYLFTFIMDLQLNDETVVIGSIDWTLKLSPRLEEQRLIGRSAVEFVRGSFNASSRTVMLQGYDKRDQYGVIALDSYHLTLSDDIQEMQGKTKTNGTWEGVFKARRSESR